MITFQVAVPSRTNANTNTNTKRIHIQKEYKYKYNEASQVAVPSRTDVREYQELKEMMDKLVGQINGR